MSNQNEIQIVLGSKQFAGNTDKDIWIQPPLIGDRRTMVEGDRSLTINLATQFDTERQESSDFRISGKITNIFQNSVSGKTTYTPFRNILYYTNPINNATLNNPPNPNVPWEGYPQYEEFVFLRNSGIPGHRDFIPKSATSYNWSMYLTYPFSSSTTQPMSYTDETFNTTMNFVAADGIPFVINTGQTNGKNVVYFNCGTKHNLKEGEWVELNIPSVPNGISGKKVYQVYSIGDENYRSEEKVFSIFNMKFTPSQIIPGTPGTFKRITSLVNSAETKSQYYVRLHKVLANHDEFVISQAGFENNAFSTKTKLEYSALTPNGVQRVSVKEGSKSFTYSLNKDVSIAGLKDNNGKPITQLFVSIIHKGYMGWFNPPIQNTNGTNTGIDIGWNFNFLTNSTSNWWNHTSLANKDLLPLSSYEQPIGSGQLFYYTDLLSNGSTIKGDFCEYNYVEQTEYVISPLYHKYSLNSSYFFDNSPTFFPSGYVYEPHYPIQIRVFSNYLEFGNPKDSDLVPTYAYFSEYEQSFIWRDVYTYGFIDSEGIGVDYPFTNGAHYPFKDIMFLQKPTQRNTDFVTTIINGPINDDCE